MLMKDVLTESSKFTKLRRYIRGVIESGDTDRGVAVATPMNPEGGSDSQKAYDDLSPAEQQAWRAENNRRMDSGEDRLRSMGKHYYKQKGVYDGQTEKSFIIFDMTRTESIELGKKWRQSAVIHISVQPTGIDGENLMVVEMISTPKQSPEGFVSSVVSDIFAASDSVDDFFSQVGPQKWVIPFFDNEYEALGYARKHYGKDVSLDDLPKKKSGKNKGKVLDLERLIYMDSRGKLMKLKTNS